MKYFLLILIVLFSSNVMADCDFDDDGLVFIDLAPCFDEPPEPLPDHWGFGAEGVTVDKRGFVYITQGLPAFWAPGADGWVRKFDHDGNELEQIAYLPGGNGPAGIATNPEGDVYFAARDGVYQVVDGTPELLIGTDAIGVPNGLAFDADHVLFISDSLSRSIPPLELEPFKGVIWTATEDSYKEGSAPAEIWSDDPLLTGCGGFGANGIAFWEGDLYVANITGGMIVRIPVLEDGTAGPAEIVAGTEACGFDDLLGLDGIAFDVHGMIYAANVIQSTLLKINPHVSPAVVDKLLGPGDGLHDPASVAFGTGKKHRKTLFISNYAVFAPSDPVNTKGPAILKYDVGVPGLPLP